MLKNAFLYILGVLYQYSDLDFSFTFGQGGYFLHLVPSTLRLLNLSFALIPNGVFLRTVCVFCPVVQDISNLFARQNS